LAALGVRLAVDDFGTGYASLSALKRFPVAELKVDRSFVAGLGRQPEDEAIVRAAIGVARALGLGVTAEGIETAEQARRLRELGCELGQGYHFGAPLAAEELDAVLFGRTGGTTTAAAG
jgi:EAL domain-containing protein (putative c-di-GMP-specific phosphodiesterase class I)